MEPPWSICLLEELNENGGTLFYGSNNENKHGMIHFTVKCKFSRLRRAASGEWKGNVNKYEVGQLSFNEQLEPTVQDLRIASAHLTLAQKGTGTYRGS